MACWNCRNSSRAHRHLNIRLSRCQIPDEIYCRVDSWKCRRLLFYNFQPTSKALDRSDPRLQRFNASRLLEYCIISASFFHLPIELGRTEISRPRIWLGCIPTFRKHRMPVISLSLEQKVHSIQEPTGDVSRASERV